MNLPPTSQRTKGPAEETPSIPYQQTSHLHLYFWLLILKKFSHSLNSSIKTMAVILDAALSSPLLSPMHIYNHSTSYVNSNYFLVHSLLKVSRLLCNLYSCLLYE